MKKTLAVAALALFSIPTVVMAQAANDGRVVTDVVVVASAQSQAPAGPTGYTLIGYWDVDKGGSQGTYGSIGTFMMALYAKREFPSQSASCISGVGLYPTQSSSVPSFIYPAWSYRGMWDMDKAGGVGNLNSQWGAYMMGFYTTQDATGLNRCVTDITVYASNGSAELTPIGFTRTGSWDVDNGGSFGAQGTSGNFLMTMSTKSQ
jgi:hypothetical protein